MTNILFLFLVPSFSFQQKEKTSAGQTDLEKWLDFSKDLHELQGTTNKARGRRGRRALAYVPDDHAPLLSKVMLDNE